MSKTLDTAIYYLPGRGGQISTGLGQGIIDRGFNVAGRETRGEFNNRSFKAQVDQIATDLESHFWRSSACVVANSYGAYLFLHAQAHLTPFPGRVLLLSPIVGDFRDANTNVGYIPPGARKIRELAMKGEMPVPRICEVHVGSEDWQSNPENVRMLGKLLGVSVTVVQGGGHMLGKEYVGPLLDRWLPPSPYNADMIGTDHLE